MIENLWRAIAERDLGSLVSILNDVNGGGIMNSKAEAFEAGAERGYQRSLEERERARFLERRQKLHDEIKGGLMVLISKIDDAEEEAPLSGMLERAQRKILDAIIEL